MKKARLTMQDRHEEIREGQRLRSVRRRLFQDDEEEDQTGLHSAVQENVTNYLFEEARRSRENARDRWNFDFEKEEPLPGRYEWVKPDQEFTEPSSDGVAKPNGRNGETGVERNVEQQRNQSPIVNTEASNNESAETA